MWGPPQDCPEDPISCPLADAVRGKRACGRLKGARGGRSRPVGGGNNEVGLLPVVIEEEEAASSAEVERSLGLLGTGELLPLLGG